MVRRIIVALLLIVVSGQASADPLLPSGVPEALKPWVDWALWQDRDRMCPAPGEGSSPGRVCVWPAALQLTLDGAGGRFTLTTETFSQHRIILPGNGDHWPEDVVVDGRPEPVTAGTDGLPGVWMASGAHVLTGRFRWERLPATLAVPPQTALLDLAIDRKEVMFPSLNDQGQLWLAGQGANAVSPGQADAMTIKVFRRILEGVPVQVDTRLQLDVSGKPRELIVSGGLLDGAIPMQLDSPLPARLEPDGRLRVQVQAGRWSLDLQARLPADTVSLTSGKNAEPWPREEIWTYQANPTVRLTKVEGGVVIDPRQTELPDAWKSLPAYRMLAGERLTLGVIRRGDPDPEPDQLTLQRHIWLDFDGKGYTVRDAINGRMTRDWRLNAGDDMTLGRVSIGSEPQSITRDASGHSGVEVRHGRLGLSADSRLPDSRTLGVSGWHKDFQSVTTLLDLPPGWRLVTALGVDEVSGGWLASWTLLDFFVVLTMTLAVARLQGLGAAGLALLTLALIWQEADAPQAVWLHLLVAAALLRVLPENSRVRPWMQRYRLVAFVLLALVALPFMAQQLRTGIYPQLDEHRREVPLSRPMASEPEAADEPDSVGLARSAAMPRMKRAVPAAPLSGRHDAFVEQTDPGAITQTGPGLPDWNWRRVSLSWNGPVQDGQSLTLLLISPLGTLVLGLLRVLLILRLASLLGEVNPSCRWPGIRGGLALLVLLMGVPDVRAGELPGPDMLTELRTRLLAAPDCAPRCAEISRLALHTSADSLGLELDADVQAATGIPLPARLEHWWPSQVDVDGQPARALIRDGHGVLWLALTAGRHHLALTGPLPIRERIQLPLPLAPRRVDVSGSGWRVEGVGDNGRVGAQLQLVRESLTPAVEPSRSAVLPVFLEVERTLSLGLSWRVHTEVRRQTPADSPVTEMIPLLPGEAVLSADPVVREGKVVVNLPAGQTRLIWESSLEKQPELVLTAPQTQAWTEIWKLDASPIWHVVSEGIAVVHHQTPGGRWQPEWRPWGGESVRLSITRPEGAPGDTLTIDNSHLKLRPGTRTTEAILNVALRSSEGGQHRLTLPRGVSLQSVTIDGQSQPIRLQGDSVFLPIHPGTQTAAVSWMMDGGAGGMLTVPPVDLGAASVNANTRIELSPDRWVLLLGGPRLGPAVLFWSLLAVIGLLAHGLARLPGSPARTWQWALLLTGLSQASLAGGMLVVLWLMTLAWRGRYAGQLSRRVFNLTQILLIVLTGVALSALASAVAGGLLGSPSMQIAGNGSSASALLWYQDRSGQLLPRPWVVSVPIWVYRLLMLAWALWLANTLLNWLRWGWTCFNQGGLWRKVGTPVGDE